ncbi:MAG: twin-arginine translocation signal domain-containing protein, partial [Actinobacteria bacterium]|nr:twin-arginine translocation signal domain-containing protein [Actinomycetota bacterium]
MVTRRQFIVGSAALVAAAGVGAYASFVEPHWLEVIRRRMPVRNLPGELEGATLAHLADTHIGPVSDAFLGDAFATLSAVEPDIVVITGDLTATYHP